MQRRRTIQERKEQKNRGKNSCEAPKLETAQITDVTLKLAPIAETKAPEEKNMDVKKEVRIHSFPLAATKRNETTS